MKWDLQLDDILLLYAVLFSSTSSFFVLFVQCLRVISMEYFLLLGSHYNLLGVSVDGSLFNRILALILLDG